MEKKIYKSKIEDLSFILGKIKAVEAYANHSSYPDLNVVLAMLGFEDAGEVLEAEALKDTVDALIREKAELKAELNRVKTTEDTVNSFVEEE